MTVAFLNKAYDDAMALLLETRNYVAYRQPKDQEGLTEGERLEVSFETMRIVSRMTQVMAWLLAQKAIQNGEMSQDDFLDGDYELYQGAVCISEDGPEKGHLPKALRSLLERSHNLYMRVDRLDSMVRDQAAAAAE